MIFSLSKSLLDLSQTVNYRCDFNHDILSSRFTNEHICLPTSNFYLAALSENSGIRRTWLGHASCVIIKQNAPHRSTTPYNVDIHQLHMWKTTGRTNVRKPTCSLLCRMSNPLFSAPPRLQTRQFPWTCCNAGQALLKGLLGQPFAFYCIDSGL